MTRQDIENKVSELAVKNLYPGRHLKIEPNDDLEDKHGMDSLDHLQMVMDVEKEYDVTITEAEAERCHTVSDFANIVKAKLNERQ